MTTVKELSQVTIREGAWKRGSNPTRAGVEIKSPFHSVAKTALSILTIFLCRCKRRCCRHKTKNNAVTHTCPSVQARDINDSIWFFFLAIVEFGYNPRNVKSSFISDYDRFQGPDTSRWNSWRFPRAKFIFSRIWLYIYIANATCQSCYATRESSKAPDSFEDVGLSRDTQGGK